MPALIEGGQTNPCWSAILIGINGVEESLLDPIAIFVIGRLLKFVILDHCSSVTGLLSQRWGLQDLALTVGRVNW
ncbi:unnamed protein product [Phytophthora fragariaefolia]|uniref:Unnamed protein product n=1 Tax=Phytophthora fragariaefolia TaxID=1490495 RepID=A0A9W6XZ39_9STRA|nr:unnamed protein product [Phytophthora fragariaefolia]